MYLKLLFVTLIEHDISDKLFYQTVLYWLICIVNESSDYIIKLSRLANHNILHIFYHIFVAIFIVNFVILGSLFMIK